jgi:hypothetical protein
MANDRQLIGKLRKLIGGDPFAGPFWPLSLELTHLGKEDSAWKRSSTLAPLRTLHNAKISIIDWSAPPKVFSIPLSSGGDGGGGPGYAIEDFGSDYGDSEDTENQESMPESPNGDVASSWDQLLRQNFKGSI